MRRKSLVYTQISLPEKNIVKPRKEVQCPRTVVKSALIKTVIFLFLLLLLSLKYEDKQRELSKDKLGEIQIEKALSLQKEWIGMENIGERRNILLYSTWRSGSSFVGGLFESSPGNLYFIKTVMFQNSAL